MATSSSPPSAEPQGAAGCSRILKGNRIRLRPVMPDDAVRYAALVAGLTYGTCYLRFGKGELDDIGAMARHYCTTERPEWRRLVAVVEHGDRDELIAAACYTLSPGAEDCEFTILVADAWQGTTLAHWLLTDLVADARTRGVRSLAARVLGTNRRMLSFAARHGFRADPPRSAPIRILRSRLEPAGDQVDSA